MEDILSMSKGMFILYGSRAQRIASKDKIDLSFKSTFFEKSCMSNEHLYSLKLDMSHIICDVLMFVDNSVNGPEENFVGRTKMTGGDVVKSTNAANILMMKIKTTFPCWIKDNG